MTADLITITKGVLGGGLTFVPAARYPHQMDFQTRKDVPGRPDYGSKRGGRPYRKRFAVFFCIAGRMSSS
jgi:hypothetical protein